MLQMNCAQSPGSQDNLSDAAGNVLADGSGNTSCAGATYTWDKEIIAPAETGKAADLTKDKVVEIRPDKAADPTKQRPGDTQANVVAHIHPKGTLRRCL
jgi:hypothetical protein